MDFSLALPDEVCAELGSRVRARRLQLNISVAELAQRSGLSQPTVSTLERSGRCTLVSFARVLEALNAMSDLQPVLAGKTRSIQEMRANAAVRERKRSYPKARKPR